MVTFPELLVALQALADACDDVGVKYFDTDTESTEVSAMKGATADARILLKNAGWVSSDARKICRAFDAAEERESTEVGI